MINILKTARHSCETGNPAASVREPKTLPPQTRRRWIPVFTGMTCCLLLLLTACGFSPIYLSNDNNPTVANALGNISIANIPDRTGQMLRNHLIDRMYTKGRPAHPLARLEVSLRNTETDLGIQKDATASRRELNLWADYILKDNNGKQLLKGIAHSVVSYNKLSAQYGTLAAKENATASALNEVGEQIVNRISLYYTAPSAPAAPPTKNHLE